MYAEYTPSGAYFTKYEIFSPKMKKRGVLWKPNRKSGFLSRPIRAELRS